MADNDFNAIKNRLFEEIKKDMPLWFSYYGIEKAYWKKYNLNFNLIKDFDDGNKKVVVSHDLSKWGL